jgi:hypothetical protein
VLKPDEISKLCIAFDFDLAQIDEYLKSYDVEDKYKDVPAFQWQETVTREQKLQQRKLKAEQAENRRKREEMLRKAYNEREKQKKEKARLRAEKRQQAKAA